VVHSVVGIWRIIGAGDQRLQRWECSDRQGTSLRRHQWTNMASLYCTRWGMSSQCGSKPEVCDQM